MLLEFIDIAKNEQVKQIPELVVPEHSNREGLGKELQEEVDIVQNIEQGKDV